jgi:hypothetical protein
VLSIEAETDRTRAAQDMKLTAKAIAPRVIHPQHIDTVDGKLEMFALELPVQNLPLLGELLGIRQVLQLAAATAGLEIRTWRIDARGRRLQDGGRLRAPEIFPPMGDFGLDGFSRDGAFDEDDPTVDPRQSRPAVGELADR